MREGAVNLGKQKVFTLAYADDIMILAEDDMRSMIGRLEKYIYEKTLELTTEKKLMRFKEGKGEG